MPWLYLSLPPFLESILNKYVTKHFIPIVLKEERKSVRGLLQSQTCVSDWTGRKMKCVTLLNWKQLKNWYNWGSTHHSVINCGRMKSLVFSVKSVLLAATKKLFETVWHRISPSSATTGCLQIQRDSRHRGKMDFLCSIWVHVRSKLLFTPLLTDTTDGFLHLPTVFFVQRSWGPLWEIVHVTHKTLGLLPVIDSMFETLINLSILIHHLTALLLKTYWSPEHWHTVVSYAARDSLLFNPYGAGLIFSWLPKQIKIKLNLFSPL